MQVFLDAIKRLTKLYILIAKEISQDCTLTASCSLDLNK